MCSVIIVIYQFFPIIQTFITGLFLYSEMYVVYKHFIVNGLNPIYSKINIMRQNLEKPYAICTSGNEHPNAFFN